MYKRTGDIIQNKIIPYTEERETNRARKIQYTRPVEGTPRRQGGGGECSFHPRSPDGPGISVRVHIPNALDVRVIDVALEGVPPGESLHA